MICIIISLYNKSQLNLFKNPGQANTICLLFLQLYSNYSYAQRKLGRSAGDKPAGIKVRTP